MLDEGAAVSPLHAAAWQRTEAASQVFRYPHRFDSSVIECCLHYSKEAASAGAKVQHHYIQVEHGEPALDRRRSLSRQSQPQPAGGPWVAMLLALKCRPGLRSLVRHDSLT